MAKRKRKTDVSQEVEPYKHPESESLLRPDVGTQAQFKKKKPSKAYRYDSSLSPAMDWDARNLAREEGEALLKRILQAASLEDAKTAAETLKAISRPFLNWAGNRFSFHPTRWRSVISAV